MRVAAFVLALLSLLGGENGSLCSAATPDENTEPRAIKLADPMYVKFKQLMQGDFVKMEGRVSSIQASHTSYSQNTFFVKAWRDFVVVLPWIHSITGWKAHGLQSVKDDTKILVTSSENVKIGLREGACVRVKGWIDLTQQRPSIRLPKADPRESAVLCSTKVDWWAD